MSLNAQAKVLQVYREGKITRVGADKDINVNVKVVAATHKGPAKKWEDKNSG